MKKYERIGQLMIRPLLIRQEHCPFDLARLFYAQYSNLNFWDDLADYMQNGYVMSFPNVFGMIRPIEYEGERVWFVRCVVGNLMELLMHLPCMLPKFVFCRNNDPGHTVVCSSERLIEIAKGIVKRQGGNGNGRR